MAVHFYRETPETKEDERLLAKEFLVHTYDFSNGSVEDFTKKYIELKKEINRILTTN